MVGTGSQSQGLNKGGDWLPLLVVSLQEQTHDRSDVINWNVRVSEELFNQTFTSNHRDILWIRLQPFHIFICSCVQISQKSLRKNHQCAVCYCHIYIFLISDAATNVQPQRINLFVHLKSLFLIITTAWLSCYCTSQLPTAWSSLFTVHGNFCVVFGLFASHVLSQVFTVMTNWQFIFTTWTYLAFLLSQITLVSFGSSHEPLLVV